MSADLLVCLRRSSMPSPAEWAEAIIRAGFPVALDTTDFDVDQSTGFRPCRFRGEVSGFEYYSTPMKNARRKSRGLPADFDFSVNLLVHSGGHEWETAAVAAGVLCWLSDGILYDPQVGTEKRADEVLMWVTQELAHSGEYDGGSA